MTTQAIVRSSAPGIAAAHYRHHSTWRASAKAAFGSVSRNSALPGLIGIGAFLLLWEVLPRTGLVDPIFLPPFSTVFAAVGAGFVHGGLSHHVVASLGRVLPGFALAIVLGVPAGLLLGSSPILQRFGEPVLELFRNTSALALLPVFTLLLGIGELSKIMMVFYAAFWPVLLATISGLRGIDRLWLKAGRSLGLGRIGLFTQIAIPASAPTIFTGIRLAAASSILVLVAAEMVGSRAGLGYLINASELDFDIPGMYAAILVLSAIGTTTNFALVHLEKRLLRWRDA